MQGWRSTLVAAALIVAAAAVLPRHGVAAQTGSGAPDTRPVILAVGESTTAGYGVARELSYPAQLQQELDKRGYRYRVVNHGVSGSTTSDALTRLDRGVALYPKIVIIALGGNDGGSVPRSRTRDNLGRMITMYKRIGAEVFLADREMRSADGQPAASMFADLARELHAILMPPLLTGVAGHPDLLLDDGRHPTGEGYTIIVSRLIPILEPYLKR